MSPDRAPHGPPAPQGSRRDRDLQRGRGARTLRDRRPAAQRLSAGARAGSSFRLRRARAHARRAGPAGGGPARAERGPGPGRSLARARGRFAHRARDRGAADGRRGSPTLAPAPAFPGLPLAAALPEAGVDLVESIGRKCEFMRARDRGRRDRQRAGGLRARRDLGAEPPPAGGREAYDAVTARAVGRLSTLAELASPLLVDGGRAGRLEGPAAPPTRRRSSSAPRRAWRWNRSRSSGWARMPGRATGTCT